MAMRKSRSFRNGLIVRCVSLILLITAIGAVFYVGYGPPSDQPPTPEQAAQATQSTQGAPNPTIANKPAVDQITAYTKAIGDNWWYWAAAIATVSTLSMALVEFFKAVFNIRRWYQEARLRSWISSYNGQNAQEAFDDLVFLAIGDAGSLPALCSQPIEKMMGEIQPAANIALDSPDVYPALYEFLTGTDLPSGTAPQAARFARAGLTSNAIDRAAVDRELHRKRTTAPVSTSQSSEPPGPDARDDSKARLRLANLMSRKLDAFQLRTQYYWDRGNQVAAVLISVGIVLAALSQDGHWTTQKFILGLVSGIVSPFVKDLASSLSQFSSKA
jgi:hypothetical protein